RDPGYDSRAIDGRRAERGIEPYAERRHEVARRVLGLRAVDPLVPPVVAKDQHDGVAQRAITLESAEEPLELEVDIAERRDVAIGLCAQCLHVRVVRRHLERMVRAGGESRQEVRTAFRPQRVDLYANAIEECAVGHSQPRARRVAWEAALVDQL